jgi:hypothetical protein
MTKTIWAVVGVSVAVTLAMAIALVVVLSSGDDDSGPDAEQSVAPLAVGQGQAQGGGATFEELEEFRSCMEEQGVELPAPGEAPSGDVGELQDALESCRELLPEDALQLRGGPFGGGVPQN